MILALLLTGCANNAAQVTATPAPEKSEIVIGYTSGNMNNPFSQEFLGYLQKECDERGVTLLARDGENDVARQSSIVQEWTRDGVSAILCSPVNPTALQPSVDACLDAGIPFINLDSECERKTAYIGVDQFAFGYEAGLIAANWMNENVPGTQSINCLILTKPQSLAVIERANGIVSALKQMCPRARIVDTPSYSDLDSARRVTIDMLSRHADVTCIVGVADVCILGARQAIVELGLDESGLCLVGADATYDMLELMREGTSIRGTVSQNTRIFANTAVDMALAAINGEEVLLHVYMELVPVTKENLDDFID